MAGTFLSSIAKWSSAVPLPDHSAASQALATQHTVSSGSSATRPETDFGGYAEFVAKLGGRDHSARARLRSRAMSMWIDCTQAELAIADRAAGSTVQRVLP